METKQPYAVTEPFRKAPASRCVLCFLIVEAFQGGGTFGAAEIRALPVPDGGLYRIGLDVLTLFVHLAEVQTSVGIAGVSRIHIVAERLILILAHAVALGIQIADGAVGEGIALISRFLEPAHG